MLITNFELVRRYLLLFLMALDKISSLEFHLGSFKVTLFLELNASKQHNCTSFTRRVHEDFFFKPRCSSTTYCCTWLKVHEIVVNPTKNPAEQLLFTIDNPPYLCLIYLKLLVHVLWKSGLRQITLRIVGYRFSFLLTATIYLCLIYLKLLVYILWLCGKSDKD